ncbi:MAG TPA: ATP-binding protein [Acidobacteriaceae bacterium]|nr:ATP-binding protein [Acidobacteriaceae bacterium]
MVLPVVACLALAAVLVWQIRNATSTVSLIETSDRRIALATRVELLTIDEETGLRGYQTTGDPRFLEPYTKAEMQLAQAIDEMRSPAIGAPIDLSDFLIQHDAWRKGFAEPVISMVHAGGQTNDIALNLAGKDEMDRMRGALNVIIQGSEQRRTERIRLWHQQTRDLRVAVTMLALTIGLLIAWFTRDQLHAVSDAFQRALDREKLRGKELFESEQNLRTTLVSIGDGVITCDTRGCIQMMNRVAEELTGWAESEARGKPLDEVFAIVNESTRQTVESPVAKVQRLGRVVGLANHTVLIRRDKSEIAIDDSGAPIRNEAGDLIGIVMVFRDVTMERRTHAALLANERLAVAGRLAATIAHEIHNPLDSVANLLYLLQHDPRPEDEAHFLDLAQSELARVTQISRAMLGLYRESRAPVPIDLKETIEEVLLLLEGRIHALDIHLTSQLPPDVVIDGFPAELRQVFTNLITNAIEAAGKDGSVRIRVMPQHKLPSSPAGPPVDGAIIEITDSGPGIPPDVRDRLFQPFVTTKGEQGTGLGLWVSQGIVRKLGGSIDLAPNVDGPGTTARVFLASKPTLNPGGE